MEMMKTPYQWLAEAATSTPDHPAYYFQESVVRFGDLQHRVDAASAYLKRVGVGEGSRCVLLLRNSPAFAVAFLAACHRGATILPLNPEYHRAYYGELIAKSEANTLITTVDTYDDARQSLDTAALRIILTDRQGTSLWSASHTETTIAPSPQDESPALLLLTPTSGSTGAPKLIMITAPQLTARVDHAVEVLELGGEDVLLGAVPFLNGYGRDQVFLASLRAGLPVLLQERFSPRHALQACVSGRVTVVVGIGFMYQMLMELVAEPTPWPRVRLALAGAAFMTPIVDRCEHLFGCRVRNTYGAGEFSLACMNMDADGVENWISVGKPVGGTLVRISPQLEEHQEDAVGEIWVRSLRTSNGYLSAGYYHDEASTAQHYRDGWTHAGDLGSLDPDGRLIVVGRTRNLIKFAGVQVQGETIERILRAHLSVRDCAVAWDRHPVYGEAVKVVVVLQEPVDEGTLIAHMAAQLPSHMIPRRIQVVAELPRTPTGKIDYSRL